MEKKLVFGISTVFGIILVIVIVELMFYFSQKNNQNISDESIQREKQESELLVVPKEGLPLELSEDFNPTLNAPRFMIQSVDKRTDTLTLKSV